MAPSDMRLHIGTAIAGYNNRIIIAPAGQPLGVSPDTNSTPVPAPVETGETGLVVPQTHDKPATAVTHSVAPPTPVPVASQQQTQKAQDHEDEKTALVAAGVVLGLVSLWLMRREQAPGGYRQSPHVLGEPSGGLPQGAEEPGHDAPDDPR